MNVKDISEDFLHYIWRLQSFNADCLVTTVGDPIEIQFAGTHNMDAGPDFFGAKLKLGETLWAGNVEIHIKDSLWKTHKHHLDPAYNNVILHVVFEHDQDSFTQAGQKLPVLVLKNHIPQKYFDQYFLLKSGDTKIPCQQQLQQVSDFTISSMVQKMTINRMENKTSEIDRILTLTNNDWEETCYILMAKYFGARVNKEPFERLARICPLKTMLHQNSLEDMEALLLGQSGLLPQNHQEALVSKWSKTYQFLQNKYELNPMEVANWKFSKMRPVSFPTIRISQFAALIFKQRQLFSKILACKNPSALFELFEIKASDFWDDHYHFNKASKPTIKKLGQKTKEVICINAVAPLLFIYGAKMGKQDLKDHAINLLEHLKSEENKITKIWKSLNISSKSAFDSQGLIELYQNYCTPGKCLQCMIGHKVMEL